MRRTSYRGWFIGAGVVFVAVIGFVIVLAVALTPSTPRFSAPEQRFLADVHQAQPNPADPLDNQAWVAWDNDPALVYEGHQLCIWEDSGSPMEAAGVMPPAVRHYPHAQAVELEILADDNLCTQHKIVLG
jgi:hypothetical protein